MGGGGPRVEGRRAQHKVHPTNIISGYKLACREAVRYIKENLAVKTTSLTRAAAPVWGGGGGVGGGATCAKGDADCGVWAPRNPQL